MKITFLDKKHPDRYAAKAHIRKVYRDAYAADVKVFPPTLVVATNMDGHIVCAAGIRTAADGFFSDTYLDNDLPDAVLAADGKNVPATQIMEVVSLASTTPFPVLTLMDALIAWGRVRNMTCGVFTATRQLRHLLKRTGLPYIELCPASRRCVDNPESWGSYYKTDPWVCMFSESVAVPAALSPRGLQQIKTIILQSEAS